MAKNLIIKQNTYEVITKFLAIVIICLTTYYIFLEVCLQLMRSLIETLFYLKILKIPLNTLSPYIS